ncbi:hypothetical protein evm_013448 [Chilo suppressalis]|nr:hypothetical protein evm_013448 [Chilo suppressalis]
MADGCGSQNKNSTMIAMCAYWLTTAAPKEITRVELVFPVPGHSFMPADRIFGLIKKEIKNKEQIINPTEYHEIFSNYGIINHLGTDVPVKDWKSFASETMKAPDTVVIRCSVVLSRELLLEIGQLTHFFSHLR